MTPINLTEEGGIRGLVELACEGLRPMVLPSGLVCEELVAGDPVPRGRSLRYTVMTWLGLARAGAAGYEHGFDLDRMRGAFLEEVDSPELAPGDLGLYLWAEARAGGSGAADLEARLGPALAAAGGLEAREGMELAWIVQGLALQDGGGDERRVRGGARRPPRASGVLRALPPLGSRAPPALSELRHADLQRPRPGDRGPGRASTSARCRRP